ncbi:MAG: hypothetical protein JWN80_1377 [Microbacteriaceae bacterium]|jgi:hypothetical protein|nr:hypothetical protein [Microbacteriaceae bacterium]
MSDIAPATGTTPSAEYLHRAALAARFGRIALAAGTVGIATLAVTTVIYLVSTIAGNAGYLGALAGIVLIVGAIDALVWRRVYLPRIDNPPPVGSQNFSPMVTLTIVCGLLAVGVLFIVWLVGLDLMSIAVHCSTTACG